MNLQNRPDEAQEPTPGVVNKKDKKLVFLSSSVLRKVKERPMVTGTQIANEILEMYREFCEVSDFDSICFSSAANYCLFKGGYCSANLFNGYTGNCYVDLVNVIGLV